MDAVILTEIGLPTIQTEAGRQGDANMELGRNLDWAEEVRESASIRMADTNKGRPLTITARRDPRSSKLER